MKIYGPALRLGGLLLASTVLMPYVAGAQAPKTAAALAAPAKSVSQVEVARAGQQTTVRVNTRGGSGEVAYHASHLSNPPRVVLDLDSAHLASASNVVTSSYEPVRAVRLGQFQPDQVRVVIDLQRPAAFYVEQQGQDLTVTFLDSAAARPRPAPTRLPKRKRRRPKLPNFHFQQT